MAKAYAKPDCGIPDATQYNKLVTFLRCPDDVNDNNEVDTRDWSAWKHVGVAYASIVTQGSWAAGRQLEVARQVHSSVDAIIDCLWSATTRQIDQGCAIMRNSIGGKSYWQVIAAINVNEDNLVMKFLCRKTTPNGAN